VNSPGGGQVRADTPAGDRFDVLATLVDAYKNECSPEGYQEEVGL
jgi:hypothetical protein